MRESEYDQSIGQNLLPLALDAVFDCRPGFLEALPGSSETARPESVIRLEF
jgi:hypothetical protein